MRGFLLPPMNIMEVMQLEGHNFIIKAFSLSVSLYITQTGVFKHNDMLKRFLRIEFHTGLFEYSLNFMRMYS